MRNSLIDPTQQKHIEISRKVAEAQRKAHETRCLDAVGKGTHIGSTAGLLAHLAKADKKCGLVRGRSLDVVDHQDLDGTFCRFQLQP